MDEGVIKRLITSIKCGACGQYYSEDDIDVIERKEELWFLKVSCSSCRVKCLVAAIIREGEQPGVITDLTGAELDKFKDSSTVGADDLLDMHSFLKDFDGDFSRSFQKG